MISGPSSNKRCFVVYTATQDWIIWIQKTKKIIIRRNKQNIDFQQNGGFSKNMFRFRIKISVFNYL